MSLFLKTHCVSNQFEDVPARGAEQEIGGTRSDEQCCNLQSAAEGDDRLSEHRERLRVAVKEWRELSDKEELGYLSRAILNDPLHSYGTKNAALRADAY